MDNKEINKTLITFWNESIKLSEEDKKEIISAPNADPFELAPSTKLLEVIKELGSCHNVLDYGCGGGWASFIASKSGAHQVTAVDLGEDIIETVKTYAKSYNINNVMAKKIEPDWLKTVPDKTYDGLISSNVLDVVPIETAQEIIKQLARIVTDNAKVIISLNFYMSEEMAQKRNIQLMEHKYLIMNGVLRLTSLKDEEWEALFSPYFKVIKLDYFAWPGEAKETRRLFILKKNNL